MPLLPWRSGAEYSGTNTEEEEEELEDCCFMGVELRRGADLESVKADFASLEVGFRE